MLALVGPRSDKELVLEEIDVIRRADESDLNQLSELFDLYRRFYGRESDLAAARDFLAARLSAQESVIFVAQMKSGALAGFTQLYPTFSSISAKRAWILNDLYVREEYRKQRIASRLLEQVKEFARSAECAWVSLQTAKDNVQAQALYRKHGFVQDEYFGTYSYALP